jgi:hypothetical protein
MIIRSLRLQPKKFVVGEPERLLQQNLPIPEVATPFDQRAGVRLV